MKQDSKTMTVQTEERTTTNKPDETEKYHTFYRYISNCFPISKYTQCRKSQM